MEDNNTKNQSEFESAETIVEEGNEKLLTVYDQISQEDDVAVMLAEYIGSITSFGYGLTESNRINDRQGKNRVSFTADQRVLMQYMDDDSYNINTDNQATELAVYILNVILSDKQKLPENKPRLADSMLSYVKSVYVMLLSQELYGILHKLNTPEYVAHYVDEFIEELKDQQDIIFNEWVEFVESTEGVLLANFTRELGFQWWSMQASSGNLFESRYRKMITKIKDFKTLRDTFVDFRSRYLKVSRTIDKEFVMNVFELTKGQFDSARKKILNDVQSLSEIDDQAVTLKLLVYGQ